MFKLGFTGTSATGSIDFKAKRQLYSVLSSFDAAELHHGDCVGADALAHEIAVRLNFNIIIHPPKDDKLRAYKLADQILSPKPYLARNKDVVENCDLLIAMPKSTREELRSGTWATIRHARKLNRPIIFVPIVGDIWAENLEK